MLARTLGFALIIGPALLISSCSPEPLKEKLSDLIEEFIYTSLSNSPVTATQAGYHKHGDIELDSQLDDFSPAALDKQRRWYQDLRLRLQRSVDPKSLTQEDRADLEIVHDQISLALLELQSIQNYRHNPTLYVELIGNALYSPFVLEYADKSTRYEHIIKRLRAVPDFLQQARVNLASAPEIWTKVAIRENDGNTSLIDQELRIAAPAELRARYDAAAQPALEALRVFSKFLGSGLSARSVDWRLGASNYAKKFHYALATDQSPQQVLAAAEQEMRATREQMFRIAAQLNRDASTSGDANSTIRRALDRIAAIHATSENYFADARRDLDEARQFVRSKDQ